MNTANLDTLRSIFECVPDGVVSIDDRFQITYVNRAAENFLDLSADEIIGQPCSSILKCDGCTHICPVQETLTSGASIINREIAFHLSDSPPLEVSVTASPLLNKAGERSGGVVTFRSLTQQPLTRSNLAERYTFCDIVSRNPKMQQLFQILPDISSSEATVLVYGESGAGKELFAQAIHNLSLRSKGPMVTINCGALPEPLLEAEIFGARRGAYTGAVEDRPGRLEMAQGGTLFLDEIGDLPLPLQVKLLRVLENHEFQPLGAKSPQKADVRFVAATHRNLDQMVEEGAFRRDLFFRLNVVSIEIPPLRDRRDDIPLLGELFIDKCNREFNKKVQGIAPDVCRMFMAHDYPGNVRELLHLIEQSVILCRGEEITVDTLPPAFQKATAHKSHSVYQRTKIPSRETLLEVLQRNNWQRNQAAEELDIDRTTLWRWMTRLEISAPEQAH